MTTTGNGKEEMIVQRLREGASPTQLIGDGYAKSTIYKIAGRLSKDSGKTPPMTPTTMAESLFDTDPEVQALRKQIVMAKLQKELDQLERHPDLETRLRNLEGTVEIMEEVVDTIISRLTEMED